MVTFGWSVCDPRNTRGNARRKAPVPIADTMQMSSSPSFRTASGVTFMPPPYEMLLPTTTSIACRSSERSSSCMWNAAGTNRGKVFMTAAT